MIEEGVEGTDREERTFIFVTDEDIILGRVSADQRYYACEVACAASRAFRASVTVGHGHLTVHRGPRGKQEIYELCWFARQKILASDRGERVNPYAFPVLKRTV